MSLEYEFHPDEAMRTQLSERVALYATRFAEYNRPTYNETEVRVDFVNPFFKLLGWDVDNETGLPQHLREVTHEATVIVEEDGHQRSKKPDYSFRVGTEPLFYLETKKPSVNIATNNAPAFQLRRYGWSGNLKVSVLTNYTDLYIYDCTVRPVETDDIHVAMIAHYSYTEYEEKFDEIYSLLSKEAVLSGTFAQRFENLTGVFRHEPFDEYFLKQIQTWRQSLGADIQSNNPAIGDETLNISVQRILNRIIFLRICEDRSFEQYETLKQIQTYEELKQLFISADCKYDSGLFEILEEDQVTVSDSVLLDIFRSLYYPNNSYEFSVVDPFIIGQIYELFLDEKLSVSADGTVIAVQKPEAVDSQGAVNTPKNVTDIIVEQTLAEIIDGKTPSELQNVRVADICCGSGNFLLSAFEYIVNYHIDWLVKKEVESACRDGRLISVPGSDTYRLSYAMRRNILSKNIWGVDIDPLAVEVTKFSLFLKLLENTSSEEVKAFVRDSSECVLPQLNDNIKNGNSLVGSAYALYDPQVFERDGALEQIKMFDWQAEFNMDSFDAIVGNPPYIRVQNMVHYSLREYGFYKSEHSGYQTASSDLLDKYYLFIERAWQLLKAGGAVGYVVPHKFMNIMSGQELRHFLSSNGSVQKIIHFGTHQVFKNRSTYTCILILGKPAKSSYEISFVQDWNRFLFDHKTEYETYPSGTLGAAPWTFIPAQIKDRLGAVNDRCSPLDDLARIFVGVQTSNDKVYIITATSEDDGYIYFNDKNGIQHKAEKSILRKSIYDARLKKYQTIIPNSYIIFPYRNVDGKPHLIDIDIMRSEYPCAFEYLCAFREELDQRNMKRTESTWYAYGRSQSLTRFISGEHLIWPVLSLDSNYIYDNDLTVFTGGGNGPFYGIEMKPGTGESIFYVQAVLNHWLMEFLVRKSASTFRGGYYSHGRQFVAELPIFRIDFSDEGQKAIHDSIVEQVHLLERLNLRMNEAQNSSTKKALERAIVTAGSSLSDMIDSIYGVEGMRVVEPNEGN
ncbi:endonuclease [bacterium D16-76]|nr:endonuclease [bacterium D16-76]